MANRTRGEVEITIEGRPYTLCLTLGALAEIEDALGVESSDKLGDRLKGIRMRDMIAILGALLRGGGHEVNDADVARLQVDLPRAGTWIQNVFAAAGWGDGAENPPKPARKTRAKPRGAASSPSASA